MILHARFCSTLAITIACLLVVPQAALGESSSPQQQFDAATAKFDAREWRSAAEAYSRVRGLLPRSSAGASVAAIRQGHALSRLEEYRPAIDAVEAGLAALPNTIQYQTDRLLARQTLATAYELTWHYLLAAENYRLVAGFSGAGEEAVKAAWLGLARTAAFNDPQLAYDAGAKALSTSRDQLGQGVALNLMGRALMMEGRWQEATQYLTRSLAPAGGVTSSSDVQDITIRADLAMASLRQGNEKVAHHFLASTGTSRGVTGNVPKPITMGTVFCHDGYLPEDMTIVEFRINRDGTVANSSPVYASRLGEYGPEFAQVVSQFRWDPRAIASVSELQRSTVRLEVHCTRPSFDDGSLNEFLDPRKAWLKERGLTSIAADVRNENAKIKMLRAELVRREKVHGTASIELLPILHDIAASPLVPNRETSEFLQRAKLIAQEIQAPKAVLASYQVRLESLAGNEMARVIPKLLADPIFAGDPSTEIYLRYTLAELKRPELTWDQAREMYRQIADNARVPVTNPHLRAAYRYLFYSAEKGSDPNSTRVLQRSAGITGNPCASAKITLHTPPSSSNFPTVALRWGFEGWVMLQADISPSGNLIRQRPVYAYPPLVFTAAAQRASQTGRYKVEDLLVPGQECVGTPQFFSFKLP